MRIYLCFFRCMSTEYKFSLLLIDNCVNDPVVSQAKLLETAFPKLASLGRPIHSSSLLTPSVPVYIRPSSSARNSIDPLICLAAQQQRCSRSLIIPVLCGKALESAGRVTSGLVVITADTHGTLHTHVYTNPCQQHYNSLCFE